MIKKIGIVTKYLSLLLWAFIILFPISILLFGSFMTHEEFHNKQGIHWPDSFLYLTNYSKAIHEGHLLRSFLVTFFIIFLSVLGSVFIGSMIAYVCHRFHFKGKKMILFFYFLVSSTPMVITQVGTFKIMTTLHLYNTIWAPVVLYIGADVTMVYLYLQNMEQLPIELDQAAMMDGASFWTIYTKVIFPLLRPATVTVILLKMLSIYNDFYIPYLYMPSSELPTVSTAIFRFVGPYQTNWEIISACIVLSIIPMLIIYLCLQSYMANHQLEGSVKL
ncbi:carbohydrate ABC transporter permease [Vagococcus jeotgali]|uniref:carbohydrate ABC transporter permease n=1 Tax=Vagococcus jeotgali TaxID=3109030 RepID=UPI002DD9D57D|nr:carbohydrate ABC transporter permease [Vagococcus sp. B2T-5]